MISVSIVGGSGCGKTTGLGLLHEGLVYYADRNRNEFQFSPDLASTRYIYGIAQKLRSGKFPDKTLEGTRLEVKLNLRFKKRIGWKEFEINAYDVAGDEIKATLDEMHTAKSITEVVASLRGSKVMSALLNSEVFIFIIDSLMCDPTINPDIEEAKVIHDSFLSTLWLAIQEYKRRTRWNIKGVGLIFAKYDLARFFLDLGNVSFQSVSDPNQPAQKDAKTQDNGKKFRDILVHYLPYMTGVFDYAFKNADPKNFRFFKSGITMTSNDSQDPNAGPIAIPLEFTANEFVKVVKWLAEI